MVSEARLLVRIPRGARRSWSAGLPFAQAVDRERTTARWAGGMLTIVLPKLGAALVKVQ